MATHSSVLAWRIPGMGEPGGLPSMGSHRVGHDRSDLAAAAAAERALRDKGEDYVKIEEGIVTQPQAKERLGPPVAGRGRKKQVNP